MAARQGETRRRLIITFATILAAAGLMACFITWISLPSRRPCNTVEFAATAELSQLNLSAADNNTLRYNLTVNVTVRNPNQKIGIYYDLAEARAYYHSQRLDAVEVNILTTSYQRPDTTTVLAAGFHGQRQFLLIGHDFERDKAFGVYCVQVRLYLSVRFRLGKRESGVFDHQLDFPFDLPVAADQRRSPTASYSYINVDQVLALDHY